jgi:bifunctional non-homologous end joining protein LigD
VPKGPSFDPRDKRLAMRVEDHPVAYGSFEGVIPQGEYGAGAVVLWDRGTWTPVVEPRRALEKFELHGEKLAGRWALVKIKGDDPKAWLLVKDKDEHARSSAELDIVSARPESVSSGRGLAEVAAERDRLWHSKAVSPGGEVNPGGPAEGDKNAPLRLVELAGAVRGSLLRSQPLALAMVVEIPPDGDEWLLATSGARTRWAPTPRAPATAHRRTKDPWARYLDCKQRVPASLTRDLAGTS